VRETAEDRTGEEDHDRDDEQRFATEEIG